MSKPYPVENKQEPEEKPVNSLAPVEEVLPEINEELTVLLLDVVKQEAMLRQQREVVVRTIHAALGVDSKKYVIDHNGTKLRFIPIQKNVK